MTDPFRFEYRPGTIRYGADCVAALGAELDRIDAERALVVCGTTVGSTPAVMDPVREGLGDRLAGVFDGTTAEKSIATAIDAAEWVDEFDADTVVGVGGGSSLDLAKVAAAVASTGDDREAVLSAFARRGTVRVGDPPAVVAVPTTLAGAGLSQVAGVTASPETLADAADDVPDERVYGGVGDQGLFPAVLAYDPELFRTTPHDVLVASAMNGFDKAVETPYAATATPVTDATAVAALDRLRAALPSLGAGNRDDETLEDAVVGTVLAQYGVSRPDGSTLSLIHAFGHALSRPYDVQQGTAHGIAAPAALRYLFDRADAGRRTLAEGLGVDPRGRTDEELADAVVEAVEAVRDGLGLPARLRTIDGLERSDLPAVARAVVADGFADNGPVTPDVGGIEAVLRDAW